MKCGCGRNHDLIELAVLLVAITQLFTLWAVWQR